MADKVKAVFLAALEAPIDQRSAYLDSACRGEPEVRQRVEALLCAHAEPDRLLDRPVWGPEVPPCDAVTGSEGEPAERAGRVQLRGEIARGGMGAVLRGHDPELERELAIKVILPEHRNNSDLVRRFVGEARLAGQLQHPGIMPVYDLGQMTDGRPFFAMKLIRGRTLADLLTERTGPGDDLPRFLRHFEAVCQAVGYAHASGVIHRDLKPLNVMIGAFGEVQVMDWGLAKRLGDEPDEAPEPSNAPTVPPERTPVPAALTRPGTVVGSPGYLPPEQARGRSGDRRSDVFGLGAILCEILTGAPPFHGAGLLGLLQQTIAGDLSDAAGRLDRCGADPELVHLAKDCLAPEPENRPGDGAAVAARLAEYQARVQERLRRAEVGQARAEARAEGERTRRRLAVGLTAAVLVAAGLGGGSLLLEQRHRAEQDREQARRQQATESDLARSADLKQQGRWDEALTVLIQTRQRLDDRAGPVGDDVQRAVAELELIGRLEQVRLRAATWTGGAFELTRADREYESEFLAAGLGGPDEPAETVAERVRASGARDALVAALDAWAGTMSFGGDQRRLEWARTVARNADPVSDWGSRLRASWGDPGVRAKLARDVPVDHLSPHLLGALARSLENSQESVALLRKALTQYPADFWLNFELADRLALDGQRPEAAGFYRAALAVRPGTPAVLVNLGVVLKDPDEACDCYRRAIKLDPGFAYAHNNLGGALLRKGRGDEATTCFRKAIELASGYAAAHNNLGRALVGKGQIDAAITCYRKATELDPKSASTHCNLGAALAHKGQSDEAITCYRKAIELDPKSANAHYELGIALGRKGQGDEATTCYRKAIEIDPNYAAAHVNLGGELWRTGQLDAAIACYRKAIELDPKITQAHNSLGTALWRTGQLDAAIVCYRKATELDPGYPEAHNNLGGALQEYGDFAEALRAFQRGHELGSKRSGWAYPSGEWVRNCERLIQREKQLLEILSGNSKPSDAKARIEWVKLCIQTRRYAAAARLSSEAFEAAEKLAGDLVAGHRYRAAAAAALAGTGQGRDADLLTDEVKASLRRQALAWLKADLDAWRSNNERGRRAQVLRNWQTDKALAGVRDEEGIKKLPQTERAAWRGLWAEAEKP